MRLLTAGSGSRQQQAWCRSLTRQQVTYDHADTSNSTGTTAISYSPVHKHAELRVEALAHQQLEELLQAWVLSSH
jgi:hypothetical protein